MAGLKEKYAEKKKKKKEMTESEKMPHGMSALESGSKQKISPQKQKKSPKKKVYKKILKLRRVKPELVKPKRVKKSSKNSQRQKKHKVSSRRPRLCKKRKIFLQRGEVKEHWGKGWVGIGSSSRCCA